MADRLTRLRAAALLYLTPERAEELARNLASIDEPDFTYGAIRGAIAHRIEHFGLRVPDPQVLAATLWKAAR